MQTIKYLLLLCLVVLAGCSPNNQNMSADSSGAQALSRLETEPSGSFSARFEIEFQGDSPWLYRLDVRSQPPWRESILHIEGIDRARNPGDIRVVTDGTVTRMVGEGTDNECVQFPNNQGMDPTFLLPPSLLPIPEMQSKLAYSGEQVVSDRQLHLFTAKGIAFGDWSNAAINVWQDPVTLALAGLSLEASGSDPFFAAGEGTIKARYAVTRFDSGPIEPIEGCEISLPLPETASMFVRLPGLSSFESVEAPEAIIRFYQEQLPQTGWTESEAPAHAEGKTVLTFVNGSEQVTIQVESAGAGSKVKLVFIQAE